MRVVEHNNFLVRSSAYDTVPETYTFFMFPNSTQSPLRQAKDNAKRIYGKFKGSQVRTYKPTRPLKLVNMSNKKTRNAVVDRFPGNDPRRTILKDVFEFNNKGRFIRDSEEKDLNFKALQAVIEGLGGKVNGFRTNQSPFHHPEIGMYVKEGLLTGVNKDTLPTSPENSKTPKTPTTPKTPITPGVQRRLF